jgi:hypothetical protein
MAVEESTFGYPWLSILDRNLSNRECGTNRVWELTSDVYDWQEIELWE